MIRDPRRDPAVMMLWLSTLDLVSRYRMTLAISYAFKHLAHNDEWGRHIQVARAQIGPTKEEELEHLAAAMRIATDLGEQLKAA
jgi:hypothetical protein